MDRKAITIQQIVGISLMDVVYIRDLKIETVIGIYDWEREIKQTVSLDLEMAHIRRAAN